METQIESVALLTLRATLPNDPINNSSAEETAAFTISKIGCVEFSKLLRTMQHFGKVSAFITATVIVRISQQSPDIAMWQTFAIPCVMQCTIDRR